MANIWEREWGSTLAAAGAASFGSPWPAAAMPKGQTRARLRHLARNPSRRPELSIIGMVRTIKSSNEKAGQA
jgi:hypothetical protein